MIFSFPLTDTDARIRGIRLHRALTLKSKPLTWMSHGA